MSEVYIRSQNREKLYRLGGNYACIEYRDCEMLSTKKGKQDMEIRHGLYISDGVLEEIGTYASKERCLEILDEIQDACSSYLYASGSSGLLRGMEAMPPMAAVIPRIYKMPES